jgi:hypothetical protein
VVDNSDMTPEEQLQVVCDLYDKAFKNKYELTMGRPYEG